MSRLRLKHDVGGHVSKTVGAGVGVGLSGRGHVYEWDVVDGDRWSTRGEEGRGEGVPHAGEDPAEDRVVRTPVKCLLVLVLYTKFQDVAVGHLSSSFSCFSTWSIADQ